MQHTRTRTRTRTRSRAQELEAREALSPAEVVRRGWQRICLFALYIAPAGESILEPQVRACVRVRVCVCVCLRVRLCASMNACESVCAQQFSRGR